MELYWYSLKEMDEKTYEAALAQMDAAQRKHIGYLATDDERRRVVAAEMLARNVLAEKLGCAPAQVPLLHDEEDRPYLSDHARYVSVGHSGQYAVCAVGDKPLAVAVEVIRTAEEKFMRRMCSEQEFSYVRPYEAGGFARFWECWTAKTALFNLTGAAPLVKCSRFALPENTALDFIIKNGCAVTVATKL